jgi:hypothetical protein
MRWRERAAGLVLTIGAVLAGTAAPALATTIGPITVTPANSIDTAPIVLRTSAGCPAQADSFYALAKGGGFPPAGQIVTAPTTAGISHAGPFNVYFAQTMKDFATDNHATLAGRYDVTVFCVDSFTRTSFGEFTGSLTFTTPTRYVSTAVVAEPVTPPHPMPRWVWPAIAALVALLAAFEAGRRVGRYQRS